MDEPIAQHQHVPYVGQAYYVGFRIGDVEVGLDPHGHGRGMSPLLAATSTTSKKAPSASSMPARKTQQPVSGGGGKRIALVQDADGNVIGLAQSP